MGQAVLFMVFIFTMLFSILPVMGLLPVSPHR